MTFDLKDFSMHLSYKLIKKFGEPYQSSITNVRRFARKNLRVYVDYERERDEVDITVWRRLVDLHCHQMTQ